MVAPYSWSVPGVASPRTANEPWIAERYRQLGSIATHPSGAAACSLSRRPRRRRCVDGPHATPPPVGRHPQTAHLALSAGRRRRVPPSDVQRRRPLLWQFFAPDSVAGRVPSSPRTAACVASSIQATKKPPTSPASTTSGSGSLSSARTTTTGCPYDATEPTPPSRRLAGIRSVHAPHPP